MTDTQTEQTQSHAPETAPEAVTSMRQLLHKRDIELPHEGDVLSGTVINTSRKNIIIDLGPLGTGIVYPAHFYSGGDMQKTLKTGEEVKAVLLDLENEDGLRELSLKEAEFASAWTKIKERTEQKDILTVRITNLNKGGLITEVAGIQAFMPLSQLAPNHYPKVENGDVTKIVQHLQKLRNTEMQVMILDFNEEENKLIVSELAAYQQLAGEEIAKFNTGEIVDARVTEITDFGVFVKFRKKTDEEDAPEEHGGIERVPADESAEENEDEKEKEGSAEQDTTDTDSADTKLVVREIDGLIHKSELSWKSFNHPSDIVSIGDAVKAQIVSIENNRVSLSLKALEPNPWEKIQTEYQAGALVSGTVTKIDNFGVFVELADDGITGLVPASEFTDKKASELFELGTTYQFSVIQFSPEEQKLLLTPAAEQASAAETHTASDSNGENEKDEAEPAPSK